MAELAHAGIVDPVGQEFLFPFRVGIFGLLLLAAVNALLDARFFRRIGVPSYGFGLFSEKLRYEDYALMFHGDDERVDVESLDLSTAMWEALATDLLT